MAYPRTQTTVSPPLTLSIGSGTVSEMMYNETHFYHKLVDSKKCLVPTASRQRFYETMLKKIDVIVTKLRLVDLKKSFKFPWQHTNANMK